VVEAADVMRKRRRVSLRPGMRALLPQNRAQTRQLFLLLSCRPIAHARSAPVEVQA